MLTRVTLRVTDILYWNEKFNFKEEFQFQIKILIRNLIQSMSQLVQKFIFRLKTSSLKVFNLCRS